MAVKESVVTPETWNAVLREAHVLQAVAGQPYTLPFYGLHTTDLPVTGPDGQAPATSQRTAFIAMG